MPLYSLVDHVSYGLIEGRAVLLDARADRYVEADRQLRDDLLELAQRGGELAPATATRLIAAGLVRPDDHASRVAPTSLVVPTDTLRSAGGRPTAAHIWEVAALLVPILIGLRAGGLERLLSNFANGPEAAPDPTRVRAAIAHFERARRRVPIARRCLPDSLALLRFLHRRVLSATLVIGVSRHPFAAHCWLQDEAAILNDEAETVLGFTPILRL